MSLAAKSILRAPNSLVWHFVLAVRDPGCFVPGAVNPSAMSGLLARPRRHQRRLRHQEGRVV
jgi:hypothetical protein